MKSYLFTHTNLRDKNLYMKNLICYLCKKEMIESDKIAKIIPIKVTQHDGTDARINYINDQEEIYIHFNCLNHTSIFCQAKIENFNQNNSRIINRDDSLVRSDILNFLKGSTLNE